MRTVSFTARVARQHLRRRTLKLPAAESGQNAMHPRLSHAYRGDYDRYWCTIRCPPLPTNSLRNQPRDIIICCFPHTSIGMAISFLTTVTSTGLTAAFQSEDYSTITIQSVRSSLSQDTSRGVRNTKHVPTRLVYCSSSLLKSTKPSSRQSDWWQQLFGFPSDTVIEGSPASVPLPSSRTRSPDAARSQRLEAKIGTSDVSGDSISVSQDWRAVRFDAEKARRLRSNLNDAETWHDTMYHSSIATRLAKPK